MTTKYYQKERCPARHALNQKCHVCNGTSFIREADVTELINNIRNSVTNTRFIILIDSLQNKNLIEAVEE